MARLLIVEDSVELAQALIGVFEKSHKIIHASNITLAKKTLSEDEFDLIILDVTLPDGSGFDLYGDLIKKNVRKVPVIFLTGESDLEQRMKGLELGAQDYILKPFYYKELVARVEMRLRQFESLSNVMVCGDLKFEKTNHRVYLVNEKNEQQPLDLTPNEYRVLSLLAENKERVVSRAEIIDGVWGPGYSLTDKAVNTHISNIRRKVPSARCKILASSNKGYTFKVD